MVKYQCRGKHKVFGKYVWHKVDAKTNKEARLKHWNTIAPASRTFKKYEEIRCKKVSKG